jgi:hypothetical protein
MAAQVAKHDERKNREQKVEAALAEVERKPRRRRFYRVKRLAELFDVEPRAAHCRAYRRVAAFHELQNVQDLRRLPTRVGGLLARLASTTKRCCWHFSMTSSCTAVERALAFALSM